MQDILKYVSKHLLTRFLLTVTGKDFSPVTKAILALPKEMKQYALFAGPRLDSVIAHGSIALVGDASHRGFP
jgi:hypothetical protein